MIDQYDELESRCRLLGHPVSFQYCRSQAEGHACRHLLNCWFERIPIEAYAQQYLTQEEIASLLSPPPSKLHTIIQLIEKAKKTPPA